MGKLKSLLNTILKRTGHWIGPILEIECFLHDVVKGKVEELKRLGRRSILMIDELREKRNYRELKAEAQDQATLKQKFENALK